MTRVAPRLEQGARVAAETDRAVDEQAAALRAQVAARLSAVMTGHVRAQIPNSDSARASSSVYGLALQLASQAIVVPDVEVV